MPIRKISAIADLGSKSSGHLYGINLYRQGDILFQRTSIVLMLDLPLAFFWMAVSSGNLGFRTTERFPLAQHAPGAKLPDVPVVSARASGSGVVYAFPRAS